MRLYEFAPEVNSSLESLKVILSGLVSADGQEEGEPLVYDTDSIINMVRNTGQQFAYSDLVNAMDDPAVKELIANFNKQEVTLATGSENDDLIHSNSDGNGESTIAAMAKKSLNKHRR